MIEGAVVDGGGGVKKWARHKKCCGKALHVLVTPLVAALSKLKIVSTLVFSAQLP